MRQRHKQTTLPIGTISSGTLRLEDLIPALASALSDLHLTRDERGIVQEALTYDFDADNGAKPLDADLMYQDLENIAQSHCPDYAYFGSTDGDGAEIGVWPSMSSLEQDADWGSDVYKINDGDPMPTHPDVMHAMSVSDHGNVTLYRRSGRRWVEVWSAV